MPKLRQLGIRLSNELEDELRRQLRFAVISVGVVELAERTGIEVTVRGPEPDRRAGLHQRGCREGGRTF